MRRNYYFWTILILMLTTLSWQQYQMSSLRRLNTALIDKVGQYKEQIENLDYKFAQINEANKKTVEANANAYSKAIDYYQTKLSLVEDELKEQVRIINKGFPKEELLIFNLLDEKGDPYIDHYRIVDLNTDDIEKLEYVASYLKKHYFNNAMINIEAIEENNGHKTAIINLSEATKEGEQSNETGWSTLYFQGSTGGSMTEYILIEGFLQRQLVDWPIDSVKFLYENKALHFDHVPNLAIAQFRDSKTSISEVNLIEQNN